MKRYAAALIFLLSTFFLMTSQNAFAASGGIDSTYSYAWSKTFGWINFNTSQGSVQVSDTELTGYAWSQNTGWINLHPSSTVFVHNDGQGNLSGYAWGAEIGYIDFSSVTIDTSGFFHGYANATSGDVISFNCTNTGSCASSDFRVKTLWRPSSSPTPTPSPAPSPVPTGGSGGGLSTQTTQTQIPGIASVALASCRYTYKPTADTNGDRKVDVFDFNTLMIDWGNTGNDPADIDQDCIVGILDFNQLMVYWAEVL